MNSQDRSQMRSRAMSDLRDEAEAVEDNDIVSFAVKIRDEELLKTLINQKHAWEEHRDKFGMENYPFVETKLFTRIVEKYTSLTAGDAAEKADSKWGLIKYFTSKAEDPEIKNLKLVKWLIEFVDNEVGKDVTQLQISGEQGAGKTDFAFLLAELWKFQTNGRRILTNVKDVDGTIFVESRDALEDWLDKNPDKEFMFVFDEANKHASGSDHEEVVQQLFDLITFLRKKQGNYVIIGHVGTDIHPWIRELTNFVHKTSKKTAKIYQGLNDSGDPENPIRTLRNIPKSSLSPDTFDESDWEWGEEQTRQCIGTTKDGDRCGAVTRAEWGEEADLFCDAHQSQDEPHPEVSEDELVGTEFEDTVLDESALSDSGSVSDSSDSIDEDDGDEDEDPSDEDIEKTDSNEDSEVEKDAEDQSVVDETGEGSDDNSESSESDSSGSSEKVDGDEDGTPSAGNQESETDAESDVSEEPPEDVSEEPEPESEKSEEETDEPTVEDVPSKYWQILEDRTGGAYRKETVDDLETFEEILNQAQWEELQDELY